MPGGRIAERGGRTPWRGRGRGARRCRSRGDGAPVPASDRAPVAGTTRRVARTADPTDPLTAAQRELAEEVDLAADSWRVLTRPGAVPGIPDEALRVYLAESLHSLNPAERHDERGRHGGRMGCSRRRRRPGPVGEIVNATAVAGILAVSVALTNGAALRDPSAEWTDQPTGLQSRKHGDARRS